jgi:hypothetical protein
VPEPAFAEARTWSLDLFDDITSLNANPGIT